MPNGMRILQWRLASTIRRRLSTPQSQTLSVLQRVSGEDLGGYDVPTSTDSLLHGMEDIMDDKEKSLFDSFADTIKHTFDIAAEAASKALEPEPLRPDEELVVIPAPPDAFASEPSQPMVAIAKKKLRKKSAVDTSGRITPDYDIPVPDTAMPSPKNGAKAASKKAAKKPAKKAPAKAPK